jgi:hypothetical protein
VQKFVLPTFRYPIYYAIFVMKKRVTSYPVAAGVSGLNGTPGCALILAFITG